MDITRHCNATRGNILTMSKQNQQKITSYLSILDKMRKNYSALNWWSSFVASKDRFYSEIQHQYFSEMDSPETRHFYHILKFPFYLAIEWWKIIQAKHYFSKALPSPGQSLQIIKSFAYEGSFKNSQFIDPMFSGLQEKLNLITGIKTITIYSPLGNVKNILNFNNQTNQDIFPLHLFCKRTDIFKIILTIFKNLVSLSLTRTDNYSPLEKQIHRQLILAQFNYMNIQGLVHFFALKSFLEKYSVLKFIYTFENNIWEKFTLLQIRQSSPATKIIGHMHGVAPEAALNFFISKDEDKFAPLPDKIITTGTKPAEILKEYGSYQQTQIQVGGSFKFTNAFTQIKRVNEIKKTLLIGMEGIPQSLEMVNYTLSQMEKISDWKVILRTHPILPLEKIIGQLSYSKELEKRLEFTSRTSLQEDFKNSGVMIYWGSTLCFEAIINGIPLIHYQRDHQLSFDPLFKLENFKDNVTKQDSLSSVLDKILNTPIDILQREQDIASSYVQAYFTNVNDDLIKKAYIE